MSSVKKNVFKNVTSLGLVQLANYGFPLITLPIISRIIGPEKYGVINYSAAFMGYFVILIGYGFDLTATREVAQNPNDQGVLNRVFSEVVKTKFVLFLVSSIIFLVCLETLSSLKEEKLVAIFSYLICVGTLLTQNWLFQAKQELTKTAILNFVSKLLFTFSVLFFIREQNDYVIYSLIISVMNIVVALVSFIWVIRRYHLSFVKVSLGRIGQILYEGRILFFSIVVVNLYTTTNSVLLGLLRNSIEVGYYTASFKLIEVIRTVINIPMNQALYPVIAYAFSLHATQGFQAIKRIVPFVVLFLSIVGFGIVIGAPILIRFFYGDKFTSSILPMQLLAFLPLLSSLNYILGVQTMLNLKMDKEFFKITFLGAILGLILNFLFTAKYGFIATVLIYLMVELMIFMSMIIVLRSKRISVISLSSFNPRFIFGEIIKEYRKVRYKGQ